MSTTKRIEDIKTLDDAVEYLLPRFVGMEIRPEFDQGAQQFASFCHSQRSGGIGMKIRNDFGFWSENHKNSFYKHMVEVHKCADPDEMSDKVIKAVYHKMVYNIETHYRKYLHLMSLDESKMADIQRKQTRRAFYGAWGQLLILMRDGISTHEEEEGINIMQAMLNQVAEFWIRQNSQAN